MWRTYRLVVIAIVVFLAQNLLLQNLAYGQHPSIPTPAPANQAAAPAREPADTSAGVAPTQTVMTVHGVCGDSNAVAAAASTCNDAITRDQFERLLNALNPSGQPITQAGRQNLAQAYVEALAFTEAARKAGLEDNEQFREVLAWTRLRTIADLYRRNLQEQFRNPAQEEIDTYYQGHLDSYVRVKIQRILVPRDNFAAGTNAEEFDKKAQAAAEAAYTKIKKGDDPAQIQKDAYSSLGLEQPPTVDLGTFRRIDFLQNEAADIFALQPGEITKLETEPRNYVIYKVVGKETLPESQVKAEIVREISQQKYRDALKAVLDSAPADFNEQYFGKMAPKLPAEAPMPPRRVAH